MDSEKKLKSKSKRPARLKLVISAAVILLIVIAAFVFIFIEQNKPDAASAAVIRNAAARQLGKYPNVLLTDADFAAVKKLTISSQELRDIKQIKKFPNLENLLLERVTFAEVPNWMKILSKFGLIDITKRNALDLSPIEKLDNLKVLALYETSVISFEPLSKLKNLESLYIGDIVTPDFDSLKNLKNLNNLGLINNINISPSQINELKIALPETKIMRLMVSG